MKGGGGGGPAEAQSTGQPWPAEVAVGPAVGEMEAPKAGSGGESRGTGPPCCELRGEARPPDELADLPAKQVVHDAGALLKVAQARQQRADRRLRVSRVQLPNLLVAAAGRGAGARAASAGAGRSVLTQLRLR
jgi:hypothetical protein